MQIAGSGFRPGVTVTFGVTLSAVRFISGQQIVATAPIATAGAVDVIVVNPDGARALLPRAFTYEAVPLPTLDVSATTVAPAGVLSVTWRTTIAGGLDWIGFFEVGSPTQDTSGWWDYTGGTTSGTLTLNAPMRAGRYEFRFLPDDGYTDVARSSVVTVRSFASPLTSGPDARGR